jgi:CheY-like chemotaxis protein
MALGALIAAYGEADDGTMRALQTLAGRTLIEYQARCAAAVGAAPIVVVVDRVPVALAEALDRLRGEGITAIVVTDGVEASTRFEAGTSILQMADGIAPAMSLIAAVVEAGEEGERIIATVADDEQHQAFERIDASHRWAGLAIVDGATLSSTAAMLGDWDLQSTLLRRLVQAGARLLPAPGGIAPFLAGSESDPAAFDRHLLLASRQARRDWPSRYLFPLLEEVATERLSGSGIRPDTLVTIALTLTLAAALLFTRGWLGTAAVLLFVAAPLDLIAERLASLRLQPLPRRLLATRLLWPAAGAALLGLGWYRFAHDGTWGSLLAAATTAAFAQALGVERSGRTLEGEQWLFDRRSAMVLTLPFAGLAFGLGTPLWDMLLLVLAVYAALSFFIVQHVVHRSPRD